MCVCVCVCVRARVSSHTHAGWHGHTTGNGKNILKILLPSSPQSGKEKNDKKIKTETDRGTLVVCRLNVCNLNRQVDRHALCVKVRSHVHDAEHGCFPIDCHITWLVCE